MFQDMVQALINKFTQDILAPQRIVSEELDFIDDSE